MLYVWKDKLFILGHAFAGSIFIAAGVVLRILSRFINIPSVLPNLGIAFYIAGGLLCCVSVLKTYTINKHPEYFPGVDVERIKEAKLMKDFIDKNKIDIID